MINEKEILKELDERINIQNRNIERVIQVSNNQAELVLLEREIATYQSVKKLIKEKSAHGAATPMSTLLNKLQEGEDGKVEHRRKGRCSGPTVFVDFYGHVAQLDVEISLEGWSGEEDRKEKFSFYMGDYWNRQEEEQVIKCKERLTELLEERRGKDNEE